MTQSENSCLIRLIRLYHGKLVQIERFNEANDSLQKKILCAEAKALDEAIKCRLSA